MWMTVQDIRQAADYASVCSASPALQSGALRFQGSAGSDPSSVSRVLSPAASLTAYAAAKAGVTAITQTLATELVGEGILVNAVLPSLMDTPANRAAMPDADHASWPRTTEVAEAIAVLASPENTLTSGALLPVYGRA